jgi:serine/threonine protein kinase
VDNSETDEGDGEDYSDALPLESELGDYRITGYLGRGSFGITYRAREIKLRRDVAIKEYMPREWARRYADHSIGTVSRKTSGTFRYGLERFTMEAQNLAACRQENIVKVHRLLEENRTSYMVMELLEGETLEEAILRRGRIPWSELAGILRALIEGCREIHKRGILHRDIKPANIVLRETDTDKDGLPDACQPVLIDFGAAREIRRQAGGRLSTILTEEYAPLEQWSDKQEQGRYTDIYALAATISHALTGVVPSSAPARRSDGEETLQATAADLAPGDVLRALDHALRLDSSQRPQSMDEWMAEMPSLAAAGQTERRPINRRAVLALAGGAVLASAATYLLLQRPGVRSSARPLRVAWARDYADLGRSSVKPAIALSPDGALAVASIAAGEGVHMLALDLDASGAERARWMSAERNAQAYAVRPAPGGGAFVGGGVDMLAQEGAVVSGKGVLVRLAPAFAEQWRAEFDAAILTSLIPQQGGELLAAFDGVNRSGVAMLQRISQGGRKEGQPIELNDRRGDSARKVIALANGTLAVLGLRESGPTNRSIWISCVNADGRELWRASDTGASAEHGFAWSEGWDLAAAGDALFVVGRGAQAAVDRSEPDPQALHRSLVMRLDLSGSGDLEWLRGEYEPAPSAATANASARCVCAFGVDEPAVYVAGWHEIPYRGWLRQIDGQGNVVWSEEAFGPRGFLPTQVELDESGGYAIGVFNPNAQTAKLMVVRLTTA